MAARTSDGVDHRHIAATIAPVIIIALAGIAIRTPLATAYPLAALLLFMWAVSDTLMLSLIARSAGKPAWSAVLGVLAGASLTFWLVSPAAMRDVLLETPILVPTMTAVILGHVDWVTIRARRAVGRQGVDRKERWVSAASEIFPPALVRLAVAEMTVIHMALFRWGGPANMPANALALLITST